MSEAASILHRPRLMRRLAAALRDRHVMVVAPAGYGKSTLLRTLAAHRPACVTLALTPADADLAWFAPRVDAALQPGATLLLDDIHHLDGAADVLAWLEHRLADDRLRFVLAGRQLLPLATRLPPLHLGPAELAFSRAECRAWFATDVPFEQTRGWPLALALAHRGGLSLAAAPAGNGPLFAHLAATLLAELPAELVHFLQVTAAPLRFNAALAAALAPGQAHLIAEAIRRSLFLEQVAGMEGWVRYHDLVRAFLLEGAPPALVATAHQVATAWFVANDDREAAIEQALAGGLPELAAPLVDAVRPQVLSEEGRVWTFRRWCQALPPASWAAHVESIAELAGSLHNAGHRAEAWACLARAEAQLPGAAQAARLRLSVVRAQCLFNEEAFVASQQLLEALLQAPALEDAPRLAALRLLGKNLTGLGQLVAAGQAYRRAMALAQAQGDARLAAFATHNLAAVVLTPLGDFQGARTLLVAIGPYFRRSPYLLGAHLLAWSELFMEAGDWDALAQVVDEQLALAETLAENLDDNRRYILWTQAILATARGHFDHAGQLLDAADALPGADDLATLCLAQARCWLYRRTGRAEEARRWAEQVLTTTAAWPQHRAQLALEAELAAPSATGFLHAALPPLWQARRRAQLVRLHALLAVRCWQAGRKRWRRHAQAALRGLTHPHCDRLLTTRDPELGARFWAVAAAGGLAPAEAATALRTLGGGGAVLELWQEEWARRAGEGHAALRHLTALLVELGEQRAIPLLAGAVATAPDLLAASFQAALLALESLPPPRLAVQLMGNFTLRRDGILVPDTAWPRPIVRKLFQYFCLHRGERLPRDRILEELWPDEDVTKATVTFHTVHSRLRTVLEPGLRAKAASRYFEVTGNVYRFDPQERVAVDAEHFVAALRQLLDQQERADLWPLPDDVVQQLAAWQPLLAELAYEEWLIAPRERMHQHYVKGCLYLAEAALNRAQLREAIAWAERVLTTAPWVEEAYQVLMRSHARLDERSLALKVYGEAVAALARELAAPPAPLTDWLAARLRRGEEI